MIDFGYRLHPDRSIHYDLNDKGIYKKVELAEPSVRICISCGSCTATCSSGAFTGLSLRTLIIYLKRGEYSGIAAEIEKCMFCGKCLLVCPRGVNTRGIIHAVRQILSEHYSGSKIPAEPEIRKNDV